MTFTDATSMNTTIDQISSPEKSPTASFTAIAPSSTALIFCYEFPPENFVGALRPYRFAKFLPEYGVRTMVLTASLTPTAAGQSSVFTVPDPLRENGGRVRTFARRLAAIPLELAALGTGNLSLFWSFRLVAKAESVISQTRADAIISSFPPLPAHIAALRIKLRHPQVKWIADFRDPFTGNPVISRREAFWHRRIEQRIFQNADVLVANTDAAAERWKERYPRHQGKIVHIWNGYDPDEDIGALPIPIRPHRLMSHAGEIYAGRHPNLLLDALVRLIDAKRLNPEKFRLHLVGDMDRGAIPGTASMEKLSTAKVLILTDRKIPAADAAKITAESDYLLLLDWTGSYGGLQVPYKLYGYLRIGRPILAITNRHSPVDRILCRAGIPYVCLYPDETADQHDAKLTGFLNLDSAARTASNWFIENFDGRRQVGRLAALLREQDQNS